MAKTSFFIFLSLCFFVVAAPSAFSFPSQGKAPLYSVDHVDIDVSAANAVEARELAIKKAHEKAFERLAEKLLPESQMTTFSVPSYEVIEQMVTGFQISQEKMASDRYIARMAFRFDPRAVDRYFAGVNGGFVQEDSGDNQEGVAEQPAFVPAQSVLVIPFYQTTRETVLWEDTNMWRHAWDAHANTILPNAPVRFVVPMGDANDMRDVPDMSVISSGRFSLLSMMKRYDADAVIVALYMDQEIENDRVFVFGYKDDPTFQLSETFDLPAENTSFDSAIAMMTQQLTPRFASEPVASSGGSQSLSDLAEGQAAYHATSFNGQVFFKNLPQWVDVSTRLKQVSLVDNVHVISLKPGMAEVTVDYSGSLEQLQMEMRRQALTLTRSPVQASPDGMAVAPSFIINDARLY